MCGLYPIVLSNRQSAEVMSLNKNFEIAYTEKCFPTDWCEGSTGTTCVATVMGTCLHPCTIAQTLDTANDTFFSFPCCLYTIAYHTCGLCMNPYAIYKTEASDKQKCLDTTLACLCAPCYCTYCRMWQIGLKGNKPTLNHM